MTYAAGSHAAAFLAAVEAAYDLVGDLVAPPHPAVDADNRLIRPYAVVYPIGAAVFDGSLEVGDEQADAWPTYQVTSVGRDRTQAQWLQDKLRAALLGTYLTVAGRRVGPVRLDDEQPAQLDTGVTPYRTYAVDRFRIYSTSS